MRALRLVVDELLRSLFNTEDLTSYRDLERVLEDVAHDSRTAKVWVDCLIRAVFIMMVYVRAEREADWPLQIQAMKFMMPYFCGRYINFARYGLYYLRSMKALPSVVLTGFV